MNICKVLKSAVLAVALAVPGAVAAQDYPSNPVKIFVGFSAGGGTDTVARVYAEKLQELLGSPFVVENRAGAFQLLAIHPVIQAEPDGYNLFLGVASSLASGPGVRDDLNYDPLTDFTHIGLSVKAPGLVFVNPELGVSSVAELIEYAKEHPNELNYGSAGVGASNHLLTEYVMAETGIQMTHIPYESDQEVVRQVAAGDIDVGITIAQFAVPLAQTGDVQALAVAGTERLEQLPDVPLLAVSGVPGLEGIDYYSFYGLVGPAGLPEDVVTTLNTALNEASSDPELQQRMKDLFFNTTTSTPEEFTEFLTTEIARWGKVGERMTEE